MEAGGAEGGEAGPVHGAEAQTWGARCPGRPCRYVASWLPAQQRTSNTLPVQPESQICPPQLPPSGHPQLLGKADLTLLQAASSTSQPLAPNNSQLIPSPIQGRGGLVGNFPPPYVFLIKFYNSNKTHDCLTYDI